MLLEMVHAFIGVRHGVLTLLKRILQLTRGLFHGTRVQHTCCRSASQRHKR